VTQPAELQGAIFGFGPFLLLTSQRTLLHHGQPVRLGSRAYDILTVLVEQAGQVVSKEQLLARAWPRTVVDEGGLRVHIAALRKALGVSASGRPYISNVPTRGYCFVERVTRTTASTRTAPAPETAAGGAPLPALLTRPIGRDDAILALVRSVPEWRFATVIGTGGLGKTTVALAAAAELERRYEHGVHFVDLSSIADPELLPTTVCTALGVAGGSRDELLEWLARRATLLVLDNCEHVIHAAADFAEALMARPGGSHLLATSREPLRARGEWILRLPPLPAPPENAPLTMQEALTYPAFELFVDRASASGGGVGFSDADVPQIASLCRKLDGIPLAIELVASQIGFYGLAGLASMLDGRLALTALGHRTVMTRHQTLRGTLDWSYDLLSGAEQRILCRLSVFRERFGLQGALAVAGERMSEASHVLANLVSKSLLVTDPTEEGVTYRLAETTRAYAHEKLAASAEAPEVYRRHAAYCVTLAQAAAIDLQNDPSPSWRERHFRRVDDVRAALHWCLREQGDAELGARLAAGSAALFFGLWLMPEYLQWLERAIEMLPPAASGSRLDMELCLEFGHACIALKGGSAEGLQALQRCASIARAADATSAELSALRAECSGRLLHGDYVGAHATATRFAEVATAARDSSATLSAQRMASVCLHTLGRHAEALEKVRSALQPAATSLHLHGNTSQPDHRTAALTHSARILWVTGQADRARLAARDALDSAVATGHSFSLTYALTFAVCPIALWDGDLEAAESHIGQLEKYAEVHSLNFWQTWPPLYRAAVDRLRSETESPLAFLGHPLHAGQLDMLATLHPSLASPEAIARAAAGANPWCAPEILRAQALRAFSTGDRSHALRLLQQAMDMAARQGANAWVLRSAISLAGVDGSPAAREQLELAVAQVHGGGSTADLRAAENLLRTARAVRA
jgi:predicted ATPase/DNA-binding winged helix-turn-helix (wHTH) protein